MSTHSYRAGRLVGFCDGLAVPGVLGGERVCHSQQSPALVASEWRAARPHTQLIGVYEVVDERGTSERNVLFAAGGELGAHKIMRLQAQAGRAIRVLVANGDEPVLPAGWRLGCPRSNSVGIEAVGGMELGTFAERTVDALGTFGMTAWVHVGFA